MNIHSNNIQYRKAIVSDALRLSILFQQVYIHTYGIKGVSQEFAEYIAQEFSVQALKQKLHANPNCMLVATYEENLVGVAEIEYDKACPIGELVAPELHKLYILERFTSLGIGKQLMLRTENLLAQQGYDQLWLWVYAPNDRAINFYQKLNYQYLGNAFLKLKENSYENQVFTKRIVS